VDKVALFVLLEGPVAIQVGRLPSKLEVAAGPGILMFSTATAAF